MKNKENDAQKNNISSSSGGLFYTATILCYAVISLFFSILVTVVSGGKDVSNQSWYLNLSFLTAGVMLISSVLIGLKVTGEKFADGFGESKVNPLFYFIAVGVFFGMVFGLGEVNNYFIGFLQRFGFKPSESFLPEKTFLNVCIVILFGCLAPAFLEEFIFRGIILKSLKNNGEFFAVIISSLLFSFYHMSAEKTVYQFLAGVLFALLAIKSNSILPSSLAHFLNNFFVVINYYFLDLNFTGSLKIVFTAIGLLVLAVCVFLTLFRSKFQKFRKDGLKDFFLFAFIGIAGAVIFWIVGLF